ETVCLDIGPLYRGTGEPQILWKMDMMNELGVYPRGADMGIVHYCSVAGYRKYVYVLTNNGVDQSEGTVPKPDAPSLLCLEKDTGRVVWQDNSPGKNLLFAQFASALVIEVGGHGMVVAPQGDGWVRAFDALSGKLIWNFDMNRKESVWRPFGATQRNHVVAA